MIKYPCIESTVDLAFDDIVIRLWINETDINFKKKTNITNPLTEFLQDKYSTRKTDRKGILDFIESLKNINAVQIMDRFYNDNEARYGLVAYLVDFTGDVHG